MDLFQYREGELYCEGVQAADLARRFGTPLYVYSRQTLVDHLRRFKEAFAELPASVHFSVKSCQNLSILRVIRDEGIGFDVVSGGELRRVLEAGGDPQSVVYAGVGKMEEEIGLALKAGIGWLNAESEEELTAIEQLTGKLGKTARVALRINPDVDPHTHVYTTTGKRQTKFGVDIDQAREIFARFSKSPSVRMDGIHLHLGSPVNSMRPYVEAIGRVLDFVESLEERGIRIRALNLGGGFGAHYVGGEAPSAREYAEQIVPLLKGRGLQILLEPGRSIAGNAGVLLTRVLYQKKSGGKHFVIVDAAMTELIRPALYGARHFVWPVSVGDFVPESRSAELQMPGARLVDVVGPVCESGDFLAKDRWLPLLKSGDVLCVFTVGAYGMTMSSQYNSRMRAAEVLVKDGEARLIRRRETYDDLVAAERIDITS